MDRTFLLVDDMPARETIYPAATRHREALDIYVNRSPLAFDSDVRAYLAERWSRSQPKEAALDYITDGVWRDARENAQHHGHGAGAARQGTAQSHAAANDKAGGRHQAVIANAVLIELATDQTQQIRVEGHHTSHPFSCRKSRE